MNILMLGSGAWGTALANLLCENGHHVILWNKNPARVEEMARTRSNPRLKDVILHASMEFTAELSAAKSCEMVVFATPSSMMMGIPVWLYASPTIVSQPAAEIPSVISMIRSGPFSL